MGDVVGLMRDFEGAVDREQAEADAQKMLAGDFTFDTFTNQLLAIRKMGSLRDLVGKMPILSDMMDQIPSQALDDRELDRVEAMVRSMTRQERLAPDVMNESRIRRIARGSGRSVVDVKSLYDRFLVARQAMRQIGRASGMFGSLKQARKARRMFGSLPGMDPSALPAGLGADEEAGLSAEEKITHRKKLQEARRARKRGRR
jgi:signal recognition particle subunit SRP54